MFYEPREDSFLILKHIKKYTEKQDSILEIGTGSGILAEESAKYCGDVIACDINKEQIKKLKTENKNKKIKFLYSDLFSNLNQKFNFILFNPPYLSSNKIRDIRIDGGKDGTEIIEKFLKQAKRYLKQNGKMLLVCSNLNKNIKHIFKRYKYRFKKIDEEKTFFEKILLYELR